MKKIKFLALLMLVGLLSVSCNDILDDNVVGELQRYPRR